MKKAILISLLLVYTVCNTAHADIFGPRPERKLSATQNEQLAFPVDAGTILADLTQITGYLGVREGFFYDFAQSEFVNYAAATIYTDQKTGLALDAGALNTDGFAISLDWNAGAFIPADQVPLLNLVKYLYIGGGVGARDIDNGDGSTKWRFAYGLDAQVKFTF